MWILKNTGILMDLYIRKTDGKRCEKCYDKVRGQSSDSRCPICYGTTFVGGYEPAVQLYVRQKPAAQQLDIDRKSVVKGKSVDLGGRRIIKKKATRPRRRPHTRPRPQTHHCC